MLCYVMSFIQENEKDGERYSSKSSPCQYMLFKQCTRQIVYYPQVAYCENYLWEQHINHAIYEQVRALISLQVGNLPSTVDEMLGFYEIKNNQRQLLSLSLSNYTYHKQAAHGMTYIKSLTFDFEKEQICQLRDLFIWERIMFSAFLN